MLIFIIIFISATALFTTFVVGRNNRNTRNARILRIIAQALTVATAFYFIYSGIWNNTRAGFWFLLGMPLAAAALPSLGSSNILLWVAAVIITGWAFILGLGGGLYMLPAGLCMLAAAAIQPWASAKEGHT